MKDLWRGAPALSRRAAALGVLGLLASLLAAWLDLHALLGAWLVTWLFLLAIALAAMLHVMIHELTGGHWGLVLRPPLEAAMLSLPLLAVLALPLLAGLPHLLPWVAHPVEGKRWFLNVPAFLIRNGFVLVVWSAFAVALARQLGRPEGQARRALAVAGLIVYFVTLTLFAYDWVASLVPQWHSTAIGIRLGASQFLGALAFAVCFAIARDDGRTSPRDLQDFGNLLLTLAMFWAYIAYTQFLIVWSEDLPHDIAWYVPRMQTSWRMLALVVLVLQFVIPFLAMLFRRVKRDPRGLATVCALVLAGTWLDQAWLVTPSLHPARLAFGWEHLAAFAAEGGLWLALVSAIVPRLPRPASTPAGEEVEARG